ncbi:MAG: hypothetical protein AB8I08_08730 [Sandaracinaceae bacterium]
MSSPKRKPPTKPAAQGDKPGSGVAKMPKPKVPAGKLPPANKAAFPRPASRALPPKPSGRQRPLPRPGGKLVDRPAPSAAAARAKSNLKLPGRPVQAPPSAVVEPPDVDVAEDLLDAAPIELAQPKSVTSNPARKKDSLHGLQEIDEPFESTSERLSLSEMELLDPGELEMESVPPGEMESLPPGEVESLRPSEMESLPPDELESLPPGDPETVVDRLDAAVLRAPPLPSEAEAERVSFSELVEVEAPPPLTKAKKKKRRSSKAPSKRNSKGPRAKRNSKAPGSKRSSKAAKAKRSSKAPGSKRSSKAPKAKRNSKAPKAAASHAPDRLSIPSLPPPDPSLTLAAAPAPAEEESNKKGLLLMALVAVVSLVLGGLAVRLLDGRDDVDPPDGPAVAAAPEAPEPVSEPEAVAVVEPVVEEEPAEEPANEEPTAAPEEPSTDEPPARIATGPRTPRSPRASRPARPTRAASTTTPSAPAPAEEPDDAPAIAATTAQTNRPPPRRTRDAPPPRDAAARPSRAQVEAAIQSVTPAIRQCAPDLGGHRAQIRFRFVSSGRATMAVVETTAASGPQRSCMARAARAARVAPFTDAQLMVTYPLTL